MITSGIYKIENSVNGKVYVGSAVRIGYRWYCHKYYLRKGTHTSKHLQQAWNKYGEKAFRFVVLELVEDKKQLISREQFYLDKLHSYSDVYGYNICHIAGSTLGSKRSIETRKLIGEKQLAFAAKRSYEANQTRIIKMMETMRKKYGGGGAMSGKRHTEESKERNRQAHLGKPGYWKGKKIPKEANEKRVLSLLQTIKERRSKGLPGCNHTLEGRKKLKFLWLGKHHTEDSRRLMSIVQKKSWEKRKRIKLINKLHNILCNLVLKQQAASV